MAYSLKTAGFDPKMKKVEIECLRTFAHPQQ